jgi:hypothetical protein
MLRNRIFIFHKITLTNYPNPSIASPIVERLSELLPNDPDHLSKGYAGCTDD